MIRQAFVMAIKEGCQEEYEARHNAVWEELETMLKEHEISNYSLYLDPATHNVFGYLEVASEEHWNSIAATAICQKWWAYMKDIVVSGPDNAPKAVGLKEIYHMD